MMAALAAEAMATGRAFTGRDSSRVDGERSLNREISQKSMQ